MAIYTVSCFLPALASHAENAQVWPEIVSERIWNILGVSR